MNTTNYTSDLSSEFCKNLRQTCEFKPEPDTATHFNFDELIVDEEDEPIQVKNFNKVEDFNKVENFNKIYGTCYNEKGLRKFNAYKDHYGLEIDDAITYIQSCHKCGLYLDTFAGEYCSGGCHNHVEELGLPCLRGASCLICSQISNLLNEIDDFYLEFYGKYNSNSCCKFIESSCNNRSLLDHLRVQNWKLMKSYAANANISVNNAHKFEYLYRCHCCGEDLENVNMKGHMYCSDECETAIENDGYKCHFSECLICQDEKVDTPPFLERIKQFYYLSGYKNTFLNQSGGFGVSLFRKLENIAAIENITLQEARTFPSVRKLQDFEKSRSCIDNLFIDDKADLFKYAHDYGVTITQAYRKQHQCHNCKADVLPHSFGPGHQFCSARCEVIFEEKPFDENCVRCNGESSDCRRCKGEIFYLNLAIANRENELSVKEPILATIHVFKDLLVYNEIFGCLPDLIDFY